tara:strand:+ start:18 stop:569 length:552 start_codon:yes stop_codon:yes gene_type:complete
MKYAAYEKLDVELEKTLEENKCMYRKRENNLHSNKCSQSSSTKNLEYIIDEESTDKCKLSVMSQSNRIEPIVMSNKNNKQLNSRIINTIPYRNYTEFEYNPELEIVINSGLQTNNRKSVSNTSEIQTEEKPMTKFVKNRLDDKNSKFDISRFQLSSRQIKGNKTYIKNYKKGLKKIKSSLNNN